MTSIGQSSMLTGGSHPVVAAVEQAAQQTGVDFDYLLDVARVESAFDPTAQAATSSARGLYQFTNQTWLATLARHGDEQGYGWAADAIERQPSGRFTVADPALRAAVLQLRDDPAASARMAAKLTGDNGAFLSARTGRSPEAVDLYLAHFLGAAGAADFLAAWEADPHQAAAPLMPAAAASNRAIFYTREGAPRSLNDIRERFREKLGDTNNAPPMPGSAAALASRVSHSHVASQQQQIAARPRLEMLEIRAMPRELSLSFAADAYRRFASTGSVGGAA